MKSRLLFLSCLTLLLTTCSDSPLPSELLRPYLREALVPSEALTPIAPSCGDEITESSILTSDVTGCVGLGLRIGMDAITLDCDGHTISSATLDGVGIALDGIAGSSVRNCHVNGFHNGIRLQSSSHNEIADNHVDGYGGLNQPLGINLSGSDHNTVRGNQTGSSEDYAMGIRLNQSNHNLLAQNTASPNFNGIWLWQSNDNEVVDNLAVGNLYSGIHLEFAHRNAIENNTAADGLDGILLDGSNENVINENTAYGNVHFGVSLWSNPSFDNRIEGNDLSANERASVLISHNSQRNVVRNNLMNDNGWAGLELRDASYNLVEGNNLSGNTGRAIKSWNIDPAWETHHNTFAENVIEGSTYGLDLWDCSNETVTGNKISTDDCVSAAIRLYRCGSSEIRDNEILKTGRHSHGVRLERQSNENTLAGNTILGSGEWGSYGVFVYGSDGNIVTDNSVTETATGGGCVEPRHFYICSAYRADDNSAVFLVDADDNAVRRNTISADQEDNDWPKAVRIGGSGNYCEGEANNVIEDNTITAANGIALRSTTSNTQITGNVLSGLQKGSGISIMPGSGSTVRNNTVTGFIYGLSLRWSSGGNLVQHNNIFANQLGAKNIGTGTLDLRRNYWGTPCPAATLFEEDPGTIQWFPQLTALYPPAIVAKDLNGDGHADVCGRCPETGPRNGPTGALLPEHYADINGDGWFDINVGSVDFPDIVTSTYSLVDTQGCTCEQILSWKPGVETTGEFESGCTPGTMTTWINQIGWARPPKG